MIKIDLSKITFVDENNLVVKEITLKQFLEEMLCGLASNYFDETEEFEWLQNKQLFYFGKLLDDTLIKLSEKDE